MYKTISVILLASFVAWAYQANQLPPSLNGFGFSGIPPVAVAAPMILLMGLLVLWAYYQAIRPPPPKLCGSPGGPPVTAPRIKLSDGRYLAYKEFGVPRDKAKYKIVFVHGFNTGRNDMTFLPQELVEELGVYLVSFDRAGYGESDRNPRRTVKSAALDIEELADRLGLGCKFYVMGYSMGGEATWSCLKYIPHRLAGAALLCPVVNYWWPAFPSTVSKESYNKLPLKDQWALRVARYVPWITYWWNTQKWFTPLSWTSPNADIYSPPDMELLGGNTNFVERVHNDVYGSLHLDLMTVFGHWEFDPMDLENPFPNNEGNVQLWQGDEDWMVPASLQRYIAGKLPWIHYHEVKRSGHVFVYAPGVSEAILKALLLGEN